MEAEMDARPSRTRQHASATETSRIGDSIAAIFDANIKADREMVWPVPEGHDGLVELQLRKLKESSQREVCSEVYRSMNLVDEKLRDVFRKLVSGQLPWPLYLHGPAGSGKSRACLALCDFVDGARYGTVQECCDAKMDRRSPLWQVDGIALDPSKPSPLFILDELGTRLKVGDLEYSTVTEAFESRERHAKGVAVYVSNLSPQDLATVYDDRIASRVLSGCVFKLDGADRRQK